MGFKGVYRSLTELFPQVDQRILKAVAIDHPKNADSAAEVVISEVLPYLSQQSKGDSPLLEDCSTNGAASGREHQEHTNSSGCHEVASGETTCTSMQSRSIVNDDACKITNVVDSPNSARQEKAPNSTTVLSSDRAVDSNQLKGNTESEELKLLMRSQHKDSFQLDTSQTSKVIFSSLSCEEIADSCQECVSTETEAPVSFGKFQDSNIRVEHGHTSQAISKSSEPESCDFNGTLSSHHNWSKAFDGPLSDELDKFLSGINPETELCPDGVTGEVKDCVVAETSNAAENDLQSEFSGTSTDNCKDSKFSQDVKIDILEGFVEVAKNHKKTLFLEVEFIMNKMREVELQESIAEQAKDEAASAGMETLAKVEELKQMLAHAKEANDMHAGEVYGERAILVTEVRELQARLLCLSDERDKALAILDEMHQTLEARLRAAEEVKKTAEKQKLEKEESAQNALAEQEAIMEKVVQESKILQQDAEENAKLRDFLMDRGRVVDTLQGEISVICHDVRLLKEKFDERVPLSKSISSSQTSCILASSGSSLKSMASDVVLEPRETFVTSPDKERSPTSSVDGQSPERSPTFYVYGQSPNSRKEKIILTEEKGEKIHFEEDDWEFFE